MRGRITSVAASWAVILLAGSGGPPDQTLQRVTGTAQRVDLKQRTLRVVPVGPAQQQQPGKKPPMVFEVGDGTPIQRFNGRRWQLEDLQPRPSVLVHVAYQGSKGRLLATRITLNPGVAP